MFKQTSKAESWEEPVEEEIDPEFQEDEKDTEDGDEKTRKPKIRLIDKTSMEPANPPVRKTIIRIHEVKRRTGLGEGSISRLQKRNQFPMHVILGPRAVGWYEHEIDEWIDNRQRPVDLRSLAE